MISDQRAKAPRGSYEAQRWLAVEEADKFDVDAEKAADKDNYLLYAYTAKAFISAVAIAKTALSKTPLRTEQFVAHQVRFYEYGKRVFDFSDIDERIQDWPTSPSAGIAGIVMVSALDGAIQFVTKIYHRAEAAREKTWHSVKYYDKLHVSPNPDPAFTRWMDLTVQELVERWPARNYKGNLLTNYKMWEIRRDGDSLLYKLEDEYKRSLKSGPSHLK